MNPGTQPRSSDFVICKLVKLPFKLSLKIKVDKSITFTLKSLHSFRRFSPTFTDVFYRLYSTKTMSAAKKAKLESPTSSNDASLKSMVDEIEKSRSDSAKDVSKCNFNKKRVRLLAGNEGNCCLR